MPNLRQELWCMERLCSAIEQEHPHAKIVWKPGDEPPDFWLHVNDLRFAVEITTIQNEEEKTNWLSICKFIERIEKDLIAQGQLTGQYIVSVSSSLSTEHRKELKEQLVNYVHATTKAERSVECDLYIGKSKFGSIAKYSESDAGIYPAGSVTNEGTFEIEWRRELQEILDRAISQKRAKLSAVCLGKILVLYDLFGLEDDIDAYGALVRQSPDVSSFFAVFLIHNDERESFAYQSGPLLA